MFLKLGQPGFLAAGQLATFRQIIEHGPLPRFWLHVILRHVARLHDLGKLFNVDYPVSP